MNISTKGIKSELFYSSSPNDVNKKINDWLENNDDKIIIDIKMSANKYYLMIIILFKDED
jgi:hypothetical protein